MLRPLRLPSLFSAKSPVGQRRWIQVDINNFIILYNRTVGQWVSHAIVSVCWYYYYCYITYLSNYFFIFYAVYGFFCHIIIIIILFVIYYTNPLLGFIIYYIYLYKLSYIYLHPPYLQHNASRCSKLQKKKRKCCFGEHFW